jgi:hypothetical protein
MAGPLLRPSLGQGVDKPARTRHPVTIDQHGLAQFVDDVSKLHNNRQQSAGASTDHCHSDP